MDEQEFLHKLSVDTNVNIELLKDLIKNEKFIELARSGKTMDAIGFLRRIQPRIELMESKMVVEAFAREYNL
jgi:hypothetical protein